MGYAPSGRTPAERFWDHVDKTDGCWIWTGAKDQDGYGDFHWGKGLRRRAHAFSYELAHGVALPKGQVVCHFCDVRACVRPDHLWLGDHVSNIADRQSKTRQARGSFQGHAKLDEHLVSYIKAMRRDGMTLRAIAETFDVHLSTIGKITTGVNWRHVD